MLRAYSCGGSGGECGNGGGREGGGIDDVLSRWPSRDTGKHIVLHRTSFFYSLNFSPMHGVRRDHTA